MPTEPVTPPAAPKASIESMAADFFKESPVPAAPEVAAAPAPNAPAEAAKPVTPAAEAKPAAAPAEAAAAPAEEKKKPTIFDKLAKKAPDAPAADKPAEADPFAAMEPPANLSPKSQADWKTLRQSASEAHAKLKAAEAQLELSRKAAPAESADVAKLKEEHQRVIDRLAVLDVKEHPDFIRQYVEPKKAAIAEVAAVLNYNGLPETDIAALLARPPKDFAAAVSAMTKDMNSMDATTVQSSMRQAYKLAADERNALSSSSKIAQQLQERAALEQKKAFDETFTSLGLADGLFDPVEIPADASPEEKAEYEEMNRAVATIRPKAEEYAFAPKDKKQLAQIAQKAALLDVHLSTVVPRMDKEHRRVLGELEAARAELRAIKAAKSPGSFTGASKPAGAAPANESLEAMASRMLAPS